MIAPDGDFDAWALILLLIGMLALTIMGEP